MTKITPQDISALQTRVTNYNDAIYNAFKAMLSYTGEMGGKFHGLDNLYVHTEPKSEKGEDGYVNNTHMLLVDGQPAYKACMDAYKNSRESAASTANALLASFKDDNTTDAQRREKLKEFNDAYDNVIGQLRAFAQTTMEQQPRAVKVRSTSGAIREEQWNVFNIPYVNSDKQPKTMKVAMPLGGFLSVESLKRLTDEATSKTDFIEQWRIGELRTKAESLIPAEIKK